jgi:tRNA nucleotidyltransferase/poly(A) polymerase
MAKLDRDLLLQTLAGYAEVNRITEAERRERLKAMTDAEARRIFASLYDTWQRSGKNAGGDWARLAQHRLEHHLRVRAAFEALAKRRGLI